MGKRKAITGYDNNKKGHDTSFKLSKKYKELIQEIPIDSDSNALYFNTQLSIEQKNKVIQELTILQRDTEKPKMFQLLESNIPSAFKYIAMKKIIQLENGEDCMGKTKQWVDMFLKIPFKTSARLPITIDDGHLKCKEFIEFCEKTLNDCCYGMHDAKNQLMQLIGKWIVNPSTMGTAIALKGPMGTGKTTLIKNGISKILNRPFAFIALGGSSDGCFLDGHSFTYDGSMPGKIVDILIQSKCNNPVIFFDELDKVSKTDKGDEIIGILTHLTDTTQNSQFHDKYFSEIDFDLSKCLFIFSYNNEENVNRILKDRMYVIDVKGYSNEEKIIIAKKYIIPELMKEYNIHFIKLSDDVIVHIIGHIEKEDGVRCLKRSLETIYSKINLKRILSQDFTETNITVLNVGEWL